MLALAAACSTVYVACTGEQPALIPGVAGVGLATGACPARAPARILWQCCPEGTEGTVRDALWCVVMYVCIDTQVKTYQHLSATSAIYAEVGPGKLPGFLFYFFYEEGDPAKPAILLTTKRIRLACPALARARCASATAVFRHPGCWGPHLGWHCCGNAVGAPEVSRILGIHMGTSCSEL